MENNNISFEIPIRAQINMIKVIGVGGGGGSAVNYMYDQEIEGVDFVVCNTDLQDLHNSPVPCKLHLGNDPLGTGAGANPAKGAQAANESYEDIEQLFDENTRMVFITAGMGGGTGTGAAPVIAEIAKKKGILVIGIVTYPFRHEGKQKMDRASAGIEKLRKFVDSLVVINNNKLRDVYGNLGRTDGYAKADEVLLTAVKGVAEVITKHYKQNIDLQDAKTVLENSGTAIMGTATECGDDRAKNAIINALDSPLLNDNKITGARNVLLLIISGKNEITIDEIGEISDYIQAEAGHDVEIITGYGRDDSEDNVSVTIVATGFQIEQQHTITNTEAKKILHTLEDEQPAIYDFDEKTVITDTPIYEQETISHAEKVVHDLDEPQQFSAPLNINDIEVEYDEIIYGQEFLIKDMTKREESQNQNRQNEQKSLFDMSVESNTQPKRYILEEVEDEPKVIKNENKPVQPKEEEVIDEALNFKLKTRNDIVEPKINRDIRGGSPLDSTIEDLKRRSEQRSNTMKQHNHRFSSELNSFEELENVPAYKRQGINEAGIAGKISDEKIPLNKNNDIDLPPNKYLFDNMD